MLHCSANCVAAATAVDVVLLSCNSRSIYIRFLCKFIHSICCEFVISCASTVAAVAAVAASTYDIFFLLRNSRVSAKSIVFECVVLQQPCAHCLTLCKWHVIQNTENKIQTRKNCSAAHSTASRHTGYLPFIAFITVSVDKLQSVSEKRSTKKKKKWPLEWSTYILKNDRLESFDSI